MDPEIKQQWVEALRSGEYEQGKKALALPDYESDSEHPPVKYCCLGVLCELAVKAGIIKREWLPDNGIQYADNVTYLPYDVIVWAGLSNDTKLANVGNPTVIKSNGNKSSLAAINDSDNSSFDMIADIIEEQL